MAILIFSMSSCGLVRSHNFELFLSTCFIDCASFKQLLLAPRAFRLPEELNAEGV